MKRKMALEFKQGYGKAAASMALVLSLGAVLGTFLITVIDGDKFVSSRMVIESLISSGPLEMDITEVFISAFKSNIIVLFFLWIMGFSLFFVPFIFCTLLIKGMSIGFSVAAFAKIAGFKGVFACGILTLVKNIILIPSVIIIAVLSIQSAIWLKKANKHRNIIEKKYIIRQNAIILAGILIIAFVCGIIESYFVANIMPLVL